MRKRVCSRPHVATLDSDDAFDTDEEDRFLNVYKTPEFPIRYREKTENNMEGIFFFHNYFPLTYLGSYIGIYKYKLHAARAICIQNQIEIDHATS
jgi:hypothetical protein